MQMGGRQAGISRVVSSIVLVDIKVRYSSLPPSLLLSFSLSLEITRIVCCRLQIKVRLFHGRAVVGHKPARPAAAKHLLPVGMRRLDV